VSLPSRLRNQWRALQAGYNLQVGSPHACSDVGDNANWAFCKSIVYERRGIEAAADAVAQARFYEGAECVASAVLTGEAALADGLLVAGAAGYLIALPLAYRGPPWRAGLVWTSAGLTASTGDRVALFTGGRVAGRTQEYAGGERGSGLINHLFAIPMAWRRSSAACSL